MVAILLVTLAADRLNQSLLSTIKRSLLFAKGRANLLGSFDIGESLAVDIARAVDDKRGVEALFPANHSDRAVIWNGDLDSEFVRTL